MLAPAHNMVRLHRIDRHLPLTEAYISKPRNVGPGEVHSDYFFVGHAMLFFACCVKADCCMCEGPVQVVDRILPNIVDKNI